MTVLARLQLGTTALTSQAAPAPAVVAISSPADLRAGVEVWVYFRRWQTGVIRRVFQINPRLANHGRPLGDIVVVQLAEARASNITVRRRVSEVILATGDRPGCADRKAAREFARQWWIQLASSL